MKFQIKIPNGCWENSGKTLGATFLPHCRGHTPKVTKHCISRDVRLYFFFERVINNWNNLYQSIVEAGCVNTFKWCLHDYWNNKWTYSWINIRMVLGQMRSLLLVQSYQQGCGLGRDVSVSRHTMILTSRLGLVLDKILSWRLSLVSEQYVSVSVQ